MKERRQQTRQESKTQDRIAKPHTQTHTHTHTPNAAHALDHLRHEHDGHGGRVSSGYVHDLYRSESAPWYRQLVLRVE